MKVYNLSGEEVSTLADSEKAKGVYSVEFKSSGLSSGIYLYKLTGNNVNLIKKMVLQKR